MGEAMVLGGIFWLAAVLLALYAVRCLHRIRLDVARIRELMEREAGSTAGPTLPLVDTTPPDGFTPRA